MEFKKLMAIGLSACMVASLAACGDKNKNTEQPEQTTQVQEETEQNTPEVMNPYEGLDISDESLLMGNILDGVAGTYLSDKYTTILSVDQEGAADALAALGVEADAVNELAIIYGEAVPADVVTEIGLSEDSELYNEALATDTNTHTFVVGMIKTDDADAMVETIKSTAVKDGTSGIEYDTVVKSANEGYVVFSVNTEYALGDSSFVDVAAIDTALTEGLADPDSVTPIISLGDTTEDLESIDEGTTEDTELTSSEEDPTSNATDETINSDIASGDDAMEVSGTEDANAAVANTAGSAGVGANGAPNTSSSWQ